MNRHSVAYAALFGGSAYLQGQVMRKVKQDSWSLSREAKISPVTHTSGHSS